LTIQLPAHYVTCALHEVRGIEVFCPAKGLLLEMTVQSLIKKGCVMVAAFSHVIFGFTRMIFLFCTYACTSCEAQEEKMSGYLFHVPKSHFFFIASKFYFATIFS